MVIANPYKTRTTTTAPPVSGNDATRRVDPDASTSSRAPTTFSQAFAGVESTTTAEDAAAAERRRALEESIVSAASSTTSSAAASDRDVARDSHASLAHNTHVLHVSTRQRGNRVLDHVRNVPIEYSRMVPDYVMGPNRCALFLSCKYHALRPSYVHRRIGELGRDFECRVLLCLVDAEDASGTLLFLNRLCVARDLTLILAWTDAEAGRYLETFKAYEKKDASTIRGVAGRGDKEPHADRLAHVLSAVRSVNKTDASHLVRQFGTLRDIVGASVDELSLCPGIGEKKLRRLHDAFHKPFFKKRRKEGKNMNDYFDSSRSTAGPTTSGDANDKGDGNETTKSDEDVKEKGGDEGVVVEIVDGDDTNADGETTTKESSGDQVVTDRGESTKHGAVDAKTAENEQNSETDVGNDDHDVDPHDGSFGVVTI